MFINNPVAKAAGYFYFTIFILFLKCNCRIKDSSNYNHWTNIMIKTEKEFKKKNGGESEPEIKKGGGIDKPAVEKGLW